MRPWLKEWKRGRGHGEGQIREGQGKMGAEGGACRQWAEKRSDRETVVGERESELVKR